jgi:hypothetical protein
MNSHYDQTRVELDDARFLHIVEGAGTTVTCLQGCLWLTRDGCARDFELAPGSCYEVGTARRSSSRVSGRAQHSWGGRPSHAAQRRPCCRVSRTGGPA